MKAIFISLFAFMLLTACNGSNSAQQAEGNDSTDKTESVKTKISDDITSEAVESDEEDGEDNLHYYDPLFPQLYRSFKVKGGVGIEQFVKAVSEVTGDLTSEEDMGDMIMDKRNGYFHFSQEGAGSIHYDMAYWNLKNGDVMFIVSYQSYDEVPADGPRKDKLRRHVNDEWMYYDIKFGTDDYGWLTDIGHVAYLYDKATQTLQPMDHSPIVIPKGPNNCELPRQGKDIIVHTDPEDYTVLKTAKFDGMQFKYK